MSLATFAAILAERAPLPDALIRATIRGIIAGIDQRPSLDDANFAAQMDSHRIAEHADTANKQHYELPPEFFTHVLGPRRKYSSCLYPTGCETLAEAEELALAETCVHADLKDGQDILELGCGWGSLSLWMAEKYPGATITSVSNSAPQRGYIEAQARSRGLTNLTVITADMNAFAPPRTYDRIVSVEMFEHMANWRTLLSRVRTWANPDARLFLHVFTHKSRPSYYDPTDTSDWMAQYFFTGGIMPSQTLIGQFADIFKVEESWRWSGTNYRHTANQWLNNFDANRRAIDPILRGVYGPEAAVWARRWRMFFLATAESFGFADGAIWGLSHYRLTPA